MFDAGPEMPEGTVKRHSDSNGRDRRRYDNGNGVHRPRLAPGNHMHRPLTVPVGWGGPRQDAPAANAEDRKRKVPDAVYTLRGYKAWAAKVRESWDSEG